MACTELQAWILKMDTYIGQAVWVSPTYERGPYDLYPKGEKDDMTRQREDAVVWWQQERLGHIARLTCEV